MVSLTKANLQKNLQLYDSKLTLEEWLIKNRLHIMVANAEEPLKKPPTMSSKLDRIICNCVLMLTENA
jgi:hypothetical protein